MSSPWQALVFWLASLGRELGYRYAWSAFVMNVIDHRVYPLALAIEVFVTASLFTLMARWQRTAARPALAMHAAGVLFFMLRNAHALAMPERSFWYLLWVLDFFARSHAGHVWLAIGARCAWTLVFWVGGHQLVSRPHSYLAVCARFDRGLGWLFALLFVKLLLREQADVDMHERVSNGMVFPYFVLGITSVALARSRSDERTHVVGGRRGLGIIASFAGAISVGAVAVLMLCLPYLQSASEAGYAGVAEAGGPFAGTIAEFLIFFFTGWFRYATLLIGRLPTPESASFSAPAGAAHGGGRSLAAASSQHSGVVLALVALVFALGVAVLMWQLARSPQLMAAARAWLAAWRSWLGQLQARLARWARRDHEAVKLYRSLLRWGRRSGLPRRPNETPLEYARRLRRRLQSAQGAIDSIVLAFNAHAYGPGRCDADALERARQALRRLRSPRLWPSRAASWLRLRGDEEGVSPSE